MAGEITCNYTTGATLYSQLRNRTSGFIWAGTSGFQAYSSLSGDVALYPISMAEQGTASQFYAGNMPTSGVPGGCYDLTVKQKLATPYLESDPVVAQGQIEWNGSGVAANNAAASSGQIAGFLPVRFPKGRSFDNFVFPMVSAADGQTPITSGICSGQVSRDAQPYGPFQSGLFAEIGFGDYSLRYVTSGDVNADTVSFLFTCTGAIPRKFTFYPQRTN
jgi:hypothetical protein